jgi:hypothetical protein
MSSRPPKGRGGGAAAPLVRTAIGPTPQGWPDYWTFTIAMSAVLFFLYLLATGQLQAWFALFVWSTPQSIAPSGATPTGTAPATNTNPQASPPPSATTFSTPSTGPKAEQPGIHLPSLGTVGDALKKYFMGGS